MVWYRLAADAILVLHTAVIAFVIAGLLVTLLGWSLGWAWVRNAWFRGVHLLLIFYVVLQSWLAIACPLTVWENSLRVRAGQDPYGEQGFIAHWLHALIFFDAEPWVFTTCYTAFGLLVIVALFLAPPRFRLRPRRPEPLPPDSDQGATPA